MKEITVKDLKKMADEGAEHQLIDVREPDETEICTLNGELIPMGELLNQTDKIREDIPVILHCRSGKRSGMMAQALEKRGYQNVYNLKGGILAWADEVDPEMTKY